MSSPPTPNRAWWWLIGVVVMLGVATLAVTRSVDPVYEAPSRPPASIDVEVPSAVPMPSEPPELPPDDPSPLDPDTTLQIDHVATALAIGGLIAAVGWIISRLRRTSRERHRRRRMGTPARIDEGRDVAEVRDVRDRIGDHLDDALSQIRSGADLDDAILRCWQQLERVGAEHGLRRGPAQTSSEYVTDLMSHVAGLPADDLTTLAELYRRADFSHHRATEAERSHAIGALERIVAVLRPEQP